MTTEEQANADALWPKGTDISGLKAMCYGLVANLIQAVAVYIGCANARGILRELDEDVSFWKQASRTVPVIREVVRQNDIAGKAMDDAERAARKDGEN